MTFDCPALADPESGYRKNDRYEAIDDGAEQTLRRIKEGSPSIDMTRAGSPRRWTRALSATPLSRTSIALRKHRSRPNPQLPVRRLTVRVAPR